MARNVSRETLRARIRQATNTEVDGDITVAYLNDLIDQESSELHAIIVQLDPDFFEKTQTFSGVGLDCQPLPSDWYKSKDVEYEASTDHWVPLRWIQYRERLTYQGATGPAVACRRAAGKLYLYPTPTSGNYRHIYTPTAPTFSDDEETIDGLNGFDDLLVWKCSIRVKMRKEEDAAPFEARYNEMLARVTALASGPEQYENAVIQDVESYDLSDWPLRWGYSRPVR
jgi:hypothetical protein